MAKEIHWVSEESAREIARRIESGELDFTDQQIAEIKDEMDKQGITINVNIRYGNTEESKAWPTGDGLQSAADGAN